MSAVVAVDRLPLPPTRPADLAPRRVISGARARALLEEGRPLRDVEVRGLAALRGVGLARDAEGRRLWNVAFVPDDEDDVLRDVDLSDARIEHCSFEGLHLRHVGFEGSTLVDCTFGRREHPWGHLEAARFQEATLEGCDLRYCQIERTSFKGATLTWCDLYRAEIDAATHFERARVRATSLYLASFNGCDLSPRNLEGGLLQESAERFRRFHAHGGTVSAADQRRHVDSCDKEAIAILAALGGLAASCGRFADESELYVRRKRLQRRRAWLAVRDASASDEVEPGTRTHRVLRWVGLALSDVTSGFGDSPGRVIRSVVAVAGFVAAALYLFDGLRVDGAVPASRGERAEAAVLYAFGNLVARGPDSVSVHGTPMEVLLIGETFVGIALAGVLGLVIANRIRMS